jgi:hypothetical protein
MVWDRAGGDPVYGADLSSRLLGLDVNAEIALHQTLVVQSVSFPGGLAAAPVFSTRRTDWAPRAALGLSRAFDAGGLKDRLLTVAEVYANPAGRADSRVRALPLPYEPNSYSRWYAAFFATFDRFLRSDLTLSFNAIANLDQSCALLSSGLAYHDLNDFSLTFYVNAFAGPDNTEYTILRQAVQAQLIAETAF